MSKMGIARYTRKTLIYALFNMSTGSHCRYFKLAIVISRHLVNVKKSIVCSTIDYRYLACGSQQSKVSSWRLS